MKNLEQDFKFRSYIIEDEDLVEEDNSDVDKGLKKNQSVEGLFLEENEDKDDKEFAYNCKQWYFQTI